MLRIIQNRSAESAKSYYSRAEYYGEGQEKAGTWHGKTARLLGLEGRIQEADFQALCDNLDPRSGWQLTARHNTDRTVGYDFNWHVPKGVSLAYAMGDSRIESLFERSVQETMLEMEAEAQTRVRIGGRQENRETGNLAWGQFIHTTARPNENGEVDPHLHAHCFVFNVTWDQREERFKAAQFRELKRDSPYFEARMHARLARYLRTELGYSIQRNGRKWDIAGIPQQTKDKFSRRTLEIEALAAEQAITSAEDKAALGAKTRNSKANHESFASLQTGWRERLTPDEAQIFESLTDSSGTGSVNGPPTVETAVRHALSHCFERESVVPERHVLAEALRFGVGTVDVHDVAAEANRQGLLTRDFNGRRLATTPEVLADEAAVLKFAREGRHAVTPLNADWQPANDWLSDEQQHAIRQLTSSDDRLQLLLGGAGTGKTTLMQQAVAAIEEGGHAVFTFAPSAQASRKVLRDEGFSSATTVAELLINEKLQNEISGQVIWIDEASLLGSRQLKQVMDLADQQDARIILSGDWKRQHGSVDRGGVLGLIDQYTGVSPIQINTIRRQQGRYRDAIHTMAAGDIEGGFNQLDQLGWIHELVNDNRDTRIAADYVDAVQHGRSAMVLSPTHREADRLTTAIRTELQQRDLLGSQENDIFRLQPLHLTEAERSDPAFVRPGDVIIFHQNARGHRKGERIVVEDSLPQDLSGLADRYSVYRADSLKLATGDRIRITSGGKTQNGQHRVNNGAIFEVKSISQQGDVTLSNGWVLDRSFGHLAYGFVSTSHASQGRTVDHVFVAESADSFAAASCEQFYVSASRGRKSCQVYTNNKEELRAAISESSRNSTATEIFWPVNEQQRHLRQQQAATQSAPERMRERELTYER
ncbi:MAG: MobF family relaxase [Planctomycetaceae bacterium]